MDEKQIALIKHSLTMVSTRTKQEVELFYNNLFTLIPEFKTIFEDRAKDQIREFTHTVIENLDHINNLDEIREHLELHVSKHIAIGVLPEHYAIAGEAVIISLTELLSDQWRSEHEEAWRAALELLSAAMIRHHYRASKVNAPRYRL